MPRFPALVLLTFAVAGFSQAPATKDDPLALGLERISAGDYKDAKLLLERAVKQEPRNAKAWMNLGIARGKLGDEKGRFEAYQRALEIDPNYAQAHFNLAVAYLLVGKKCDATAEAAALERLDAELFEKLGWLTRITCDPLGCGCGP